MPPVVDLSVAAVAVRALAISRGVLHYCERLVTGVPAPLQKMVPLGTPWQYWMLVLNHGLPPTPLKKPLR